MKFNDYFKKITTDDFVNVTTTMMQALFDGCSEKAYAVNHQHYLILCPYNDGRKITVLDTGELKISGDNLHVPFVKLARYFENQGIEWRDK